MSMSFATQECLNKAKVIGWDLSLLPIKCLLNKLGNPQNNIKTIHVTGTNGKGSVCAFLRSILMESGYRVGMYNSPAVESELERYTINGQWIDKDIYESLLDIISKACIQVESDGFRHPSLFEIETALAFLYFSQSNCHVNIIEVGMGGRLDATNVIDNTMLCVFTSIGLDHSNFLGSTLEEIAQNKAGIIKPSANVISAIQTPEVEMVLKSAAIGQNCNIKFVKPLNDNFNLGLNGIFQYQNAAIAQECALYLKDIGFHITEETILEGLANTKWPFRYEKISDKPLIILDGAHNYPAVVKLMESIRRDFNDSKVTFLISVLKDKEYDDMFSLILPLAQNTVVVQSLNDRGLNLDDLFSCAYKYSKNTYKAIDFNDAANKAISLSSDLIICFGTFSFLNDIKKAFKEII